MPSPRCPPDRPLQSRPVEPLRRPPVTFAHPVVDPVASSAPQDPLGLYRAALEAGAGGLQASAWRTEDGVVVLHDGGHVRRGLRRRPVSDLSRLELPPSVPSLGDVYDACGTAFELSLNVPDTETAAAAVDAARAAHPGAPKHLWISHPDWRRLGEWRERFPDVHLVNRTRLREIREGPERRAAELARSGVDAVNLHCTDWTGGLTTLFHRFERLAFGWDAQHERVLRALARMGIDGVYGNHVDRMVAVLGPRPAG